MTSSDNSSFTETEDPLAENALTPEQKRIWFAHLERVRQHYVALYSSNPLHQARAAKDPNYWKHFSMGIVNMPGVETPQFH